MNSRSYRILDASVKILLAILVWVLPTAPAFAQLPGLPCPPGLACPGTGGGVSSVNGLILTVIGWLTGIAFAVAVLFLIIGGFWYMTSAGNVESAEKAKNTVVNAIIGIVIIILSYVIISVIVNLVSGNRSPSP